MASEESCRAAGEVGALMTPEPMTAPPDTPVGEVWRTMTERRFRHMPVVKDGGGLVGILTQRDLLVAAHASERRIDLDDGRPVSELMNRQVDATRVLRSGGRPPHAANEAKLPARRGRDGRRRWDSHRG